MNGFVHLGNVHEELLLSELYTLRVERLAILLEVLD